LLSVDRCFSVKPRPTTPIGINSMWLQVEKDCEGFPGRSHVWNIPYTRCPTKHKFSHARNRHGGAVFRHVALLPASLVSSVPALGVISYIHEQVRLCRSLQPFSRQSAYSMHRNAGMLSKLIPGVDRGMRKGSPRFPVFSSPPSACTVHNGRLWSSIRPHKPVIFWLFVAYDINLGFVVLAWGNLSSHQHPVEIAA